jgi:hypothetical protein
MKSLILKVILFAMAASQSVLADSLTPALVNAQMNQCSPEEVARISEQAQRAALDRVRADLNAEGRARVDAIGSDPQNCLNNAYRKAERETQRVISECVSKTTVFRSCQIQETRIVQQPMAILAISGVGRIDDRKTDEASCKLNAQENAKRDAIANCERALGVRCRLAGPASEATHSVDRRRRFGIVGPKEDYHICAARAEALPDSSDILQCSVEVVARIQL